MRKKEPLTYTCVGIHSKNIVHVGAMSSQDSDANVDHTLILRRTGTSWTGKAFGESVVAITSIHSPKPATVFLSASGKVLLAHFPGFSEEEVDESGSGPSSLLPLRAGQTIKDHVLAVGMGRRAYLRSPSGIWSRIDAGMFVQPESRDRATGLLAVAGRSLQDVFACGYKGEIWHYDGKKWKQENTPTKVALTTLQCMPNNQVVCAGLGGTILRRDGQRWRTIKHSMPNMDFWGSAVFRNTLYLATRNGLFTLSDDDVLQRVSWNLPTITSTSFLCASEGIMWSVGANDLAMTSDGVSWSLIAGP